MGGEGGRRGWEGGREERVGGEGGRRGWEEREERVEGRRGWEERVGGEGGREGGRRWEGGRKGRVAAITQVINTQSTMEKWKKNDADKTEEKRDEPLKLTMP